MHIPLKQIITSNSILKCVALYLGYMTWMTLNQYQGSHLWLEIPLSFYNIPAGITLMGPEKIQVQIHSKKNKLIALDKTTLAAHINAQQFAVGPQKIILQEDFLLLPADFKLLNYAPQNIIVQAQLDNPLEKQA